MRLTKIVRPREEETSARRRYAEDDRAIARGAIATVAAGYCVDAVLWKEAWRLQVECCSETHPSPIVRSPFVIYDVIVVGGGVLGATVAYLSAREGLRTLLLDRLDEGRATDAGAGIILPRTSTRSEALFDLGLRSAAYYPTLLEFSRRTAAGIPATPSAGISESL
jgi:hypothetical protein